MNSRPGRHVAADTVGGDGPAQLKSVARDFIASEILRRAANDEQVYRALDYLYSNAEERIAKVEFDGRHSLSAFEVAGQISSAGRIER